MTHGQITDRHYKRPFSPHARAQPGRAGQSAEDEARSTLLIHSSVCWLCPWSHGTRKVEKRQKAAHRSGLSLAKGSPHTGELPVPWESLHHSCETV